MSNKEDLLLAALGIALICLSAGPILAIGVATILAISAYLRHQKAGK